VGPAGVAGGLVDAPGQETGRPRAQQDEPRSDVILATAEFLDGTPDQRERLISMAGEGVGGSESRGGVRCELGAAVGTGAGQRRGALFTEPRARAILMMAPHTLHGESPLTPPSESSRTSLDKLAY
jgi:hypothetical protein